MTSHQKLWSKSGLITTEGRATEQSVVRTRREWIVERMRRGNMNMN